MYAISGIQQVGIGIPNVEEAFAWYRQHFGMNVPIFDDDGRAELMLPYTGNQAQERRAILAINMQGGSGFEIWQYKSRQPQPPDFHIEMGDLGLYAAKMKCLDIKAAYEELSEKQTNILGEITKTPNGRAHFFMRDPYNNLFEIIEQNDWFKSGGYHTGGPAGTIIGVSDIDRSLALYQTVLGYDKIVYDETNTFDDLKVLPAGDHRLRRVLLTHSQPRQGAFSRLFGKSYIELIQVEGRQARKIYENRLWGDLGFIHLCFDVIDMDHLQEVCQEKGFPFTVDTGETFDMGEAAGRFAYIEDPDGTLIEFVETYKIPIMKKWNWFLDLRKRDAYKPLPDWMLKALGFNKVKD